MAPSRPGASWRLAVLVILAVVVLGGCAEWGRGKSGVVYSAHVTRVIETGRRAIPGGPTQLFQRLEVELEEGLYRGDRAETQWAGRGALNEQGLLAPGDRVLVSDQVGDDGSRVYVIEEVVRLPLLAPLAALLAVALVVVARRKGLASIIGLAGSVAVFLAVVVPAVRRGDDPLAFTLAASLAVLVVSVYLVHGLNRKSTAALLGAAGAVALVAALAAAGLQLEHLTGFGSEENVFLVVSADAPIDLPRLLLAGIIVSSLGALVDMSVGQSSATFELASVDPTLRGRELYARALNVGTDHIGSLVNTLALAYFGASLPFAALLSVGNAPLALGLNSETIALSILTVLVASIGLVVCVPLTTLIAVRLASDDGPRR